MNIVLYLLGLSYFVMQKQFFYIFLAIYGVYKLVRRSFSANSSLLGQLTVKGTEWMEQGYIPVFLLRLGIRLVIDERFTNLNKYYTEIQSKKQKQFVKQHMRHGPIAIDVQKANDQHYEVPAEFFEICLGKRKKYSCCYFENSEQSLEEAEEKMLTLTCNRAGVKDGMTILDAGCGWGSMSLWLAEKYPNAQITGVSNSNSQRQHIMQKAAEKGFQNLKIITCDMNKYEASQNTYDRVISIEMFEHLRNWEFIFQRVSSWLKPDGQFFIHTFCHQSSVYPFESQGDTNWMAQNFFSGGIMPSAHLVYQFQKHLSVDETWMVNGTHYYLTCIKWWERMERNKQTVMNIFQRVYGTGQGQKWFYRWTMFYLACAQLFIHSEGNQWFVCHHLLSKNGLVKNQNN